MCRRPSSGFSPGPHNTRWRPTCVNQSRRFLWDTSHTFWTFEAVTSLSDAEQDVLAFNEYLILERLKTHKLNESGVCSDVSCQSFYWHLFFYCAILLSAFWAHGIWWLQSFKSLATGKYRHPAIFPVQYPLNPVIVIHLCFHLLWPHAIIRNKSFRR